MFRRLCHDEKGAAMALAAASLTVLLLCAGLALDFGRAHLLKAQLQTAVDAASLAGALQVIPMAELEIYRERYVDRTCRDPVSGLPYDCSGWVSASPVRLSGTQWELIHLGLWREMAGGSCRDPYDCHSYAIVREWLVLPATTTPVAQQTFHMNTHWPTGPLGPQVHDLTIQINQARAEVTATARLTTPTTFLKLVGIRELEFVRSGTAVPVRR